MFNWQAFHFMRPEWLLLLLPFVWIIFVLIKKEQVQLQWQEIIAPHILKHLSVGHSEYHWLNPTNLSAIILVVAIIMLAGPSWTRQITPLSQDQSSLVIILDASESMDQSDIQPSRLERSKQKIQDLLELRKGSKTALIAFAGSAHTVLPLSNDKDILINYLQAINTRIIPVTGKFPEKALINTLDLETNNDTGRDTPLTVLWIGDGFSSQTSELFENYFKVNQHQLIILGIGKTQQQLSDDEKLQIVPLEKNALQDIASSNGGYYVQATTDNEDVTRINSYIDRHFVDVDDEYSPWLDQGYYLVFFIMPLFLLWFRRGWTLHWGFLLFITLSTAIPEPAYAEQTNVAQTDGEQAQVSNSSLIDWWLTPNQQGHWYYSKGKPLIAAQRFQDPLWKGVAYYQAEEFKLAAEYFSRIDSEQGLFYLANSLAHGQDYLKAIVIYDRLLKIDPDHQQAQTNRKIVRDLADAINLMSESQRTEEDGAGGSKALGDDDAKRAEGAEYQTFVKDEENKRLSAEDIMQDVALHEMWMRNVQPDPSNFLASKFHMQKDNSESAPEETETEETSP